MSEPRCCEHGCRLYFELKQAKQLNHPWIKTLTRSLRDHRKSCTANPADFRK